MVVQNAQVLPSSGLSDPTLAFNLNGILDWSPAMPFLDLMKQARPFFAHGSGGTWEGMSHEALVSGGWLDAEGWPREIPPDMPWVGTIWDWADSAGDATLAASRAGTYVLHYEGEGTVLLGMGARVISQRPGEIVFRNETGGAMLLGISATDPNQTGDHIRNVTVLRQEYQPLYDMGEIFNPDWLALIQDARVLRFKDWMGTDWATSETWSGAWADRPESLDANYRSKGVPVEVMVALANQTGTEPWFTMPAGASADYIRQFATYVRDHLDPGLRVHVEYSNEMWNWGYGQTKWLAAEAQRLWGSPDKAAWLDYQVMLATQSALIWTEVFGDQTAARLDRVLATQTANPWVAGRLLEAPLWQAMDPAGYVAPGTVFDSLAVTSYFGGATMRDADLRIALLTQIRADPVAAVAWLTDRMLDPAYVQSIPQIAAYWDQNKALADRYGLDLVAYEGGQHLLQGWQITGIDAADQALLTAFLSAYVRSPEMAGLYQALWDAWARVGDGPFMHLNEVAQPSKWGAWGLYTSLGDHNPRADLLTHLNETQASWFGNGGGVHYQQGVIVLASDGAGQDGTGQGGTGQGGATLTGTDLDDFLIGARGNDRFTPGQGQDAISGEGGRDILVLNGAPEDYTLTANGDLYRLTGLGSSYLLRSVEILKFDEGVTRFLDQYLPGPSAPEGPVLSAKTGLRLEASAAGIVQIRAVVDPLGQGVTIRAIGPGSALGQALGLTTADSYQTGPALGTTLAEALAQGSVITTARAIRATGGNDMFCGLWADDMVFGMAGNDTLYGRSGKDTLDGGPGLDRILGGLDDDLLSGGAGPDVFVFVAGHGRDVITDLTPRDTLDLRGWALAGRAGLLASATEDAAGNLVLHNSGSDSITLRGLILGDLTWVETLL